MNKRPLLFLTSLWWIGVAAWIINYNLAPFGTTTLHWNNPARPTAAFTWHVQPQSTEGQVVIPPDGMRSLNATLPRGFSTGTLKVKSDRPGQFRLAAETQANQPAMSQTVQGTVGKLEITWSKLQARGRTFSFQIVNLDDRPLSLNSITIVAQR